MLKISTEELYNKITGEEDARVCKDIPDSACEEQPRNFFAYLSANVLGKIADELSSARIVLPWLYSMLGVPALFVGFLVPIREAGVLLPQLLVAALVRHMPKRKGVWLAGAVLSSMALAAMAFVVGTVDGYLAGALLTIALVVYSLARGLCSVSAKDVLGKAISKSRRGTLMGWSASISGVAVLLVGFWFSSGGIESADSTFFMFLLLVASVLWIMASLSFAVIYEAPGATEGGGNALDVARQHFRILATDHDFRRFITARSLLLSVALAPPFFVLLLHQVSELGLLGLGILVIANGVGSAVSSPFWGYFGDRSSRSVMSLAALGAGVMSLIAALSVYFQWSYLAGETGLAILFFLHSIMRDGVRLGRKVYLVDMANQQNRAAYVALSNTLIGIVMLLAGFFGLFADYTGIPAALFALGILSLLAALYSARLREVSDPL